MGPLVADDLEFVHQAPLDLAQGVAEDRVPVIEHRAEERLGVVPVDLLRRLAPGRLPRRPQPRLQLPLHERPKPGRHELEALAYPVAIGDRHDSSLPLLALGWFASRQGLEHVWAKELDPDPM